MDLLEIYQLLWQPNIFYIYASSVGMYEYQRVVVGGVRGVELVVFRTHKISKHKQSEIICRCITLFHSLVIYFFGVKSWWNTITVWCGSFFRMII